MVMLSRGEPRYTYRCDVCGSSAPGDSADAPPPGFATIALRPTGKPGTTAHVCIGPCLTIAADNMAEGMPPSGDPPTLRIG
jgi:hypothetical protein